MKFILDVNSYGKRAIAVLFFLLIFSGVALSQVLNSTEIDKLNLSDLDLWLTSNPILAKEAGDYFYQSALDSLSRNEISGSLKYLDKAERVAVFVKDNLLLAKSLWKKGSAYTRQKENKLSNGYLLRAKSSFEKNGSEYSKWAIFQILIEVSINYDVLGLVSEHEKSLRETYEYALTRGDRQLAITSYNIALFFHDRYPHRALLWYQNSLNKNVAIKEIIYIRISTFFFYRGEYELAFEYLDKAEREFAEKDNTKNIWEMWQKYGEYYLLLGRYNDSIEYLKKNCAWQLEQRNYQQAVVCQAGLIIRYLEINNIPLAEENIALAEKITNERNVSESGKLHILYQKGYLLYKRGRFSEAEDIFDRIYPQKEIMPWLAIKNLYWYRALVYYKQRRLDRALSEIESIVIKLRELKENDQIPKFLVFRGKILFEMNRKPESLAAFQESIDLIEKGRKQIHNIRTSLDYFDKYKEAYEYLLKIALEKDEDSKSIVLADLLKSRVLADKVLSANPDPKNQFQSYQSFYKSKEAEELLNQIWILSERSFAENIDNGAEIAKLEEKFQERLEAYNLRENKKYDFAQAELSKGDMSHLKGIDANIISFSFLPDGKLARFLFSKNKAVRIAELPLNKKDLGEKIKAFRRDLVSLGPFRENARQLYELLLPGGSEIDFSKPLIIIPDDILWSLPFSALIDGNGKYLIEKNAIALLPSLKSLVLLDQSKTPGNPGPKKTAVFSNSIADGRPALDAAKGEIDDIARLYPGSAIFAEAKANEESFKKFAPGSSIIHIASHGSINLENPFESALLLRKTEKDDGRLSVNEIMGIRVPSSLVVLSACDTSNGQIFGGEGLLSLSWAFLLSGADNVVGAQWKVNDEQSKKLMVEFHKELKKGNNPIHSLQFVQKKAIKNKVPFDHPYYWAGFVSTGAFR